MENITFLPPATSTRFTAITRRIW